MPCADCARCSVGATNRATPSRTTAPGCPKRQASRRTASPSVLTTCRRLLDAATRSPRPARNRALLALLISTGIRRAEAATVNIEDLRIDADGSGIAQVTGKRTKANKSGRRAVAFDRAAGHYLVAFLDAEGRTSGPLFTGARQDEPISPQTIYRIVKCCVEEAGLSDRMTATHDLRRAFATHLARYVASEGANSEVAADMIRRQLGPQALFNDRRIQPA